MFAHTLWNNFEANFEHFSESTKVGGQFFNTKWFVNETAVDIELIFRRGDARVSFLNRSVMKSTNRFPD